MLVQNVLAISPADGEVVEIVQEKEEKYLGRAVVRVSIFLNLHCSMFSECPLRGTVRQVTHVPGQFYAGVSPRSVRCE